MPSEKQFRTLFGPIRSRRLGLSLGVDLVPEKTCCYDCQFCQIQVRSTLTCERRDYVPVASVMSELEGWLAAGGKADAITLSGSGEPTLHAKFGDVLSGIRERTPIRRVLLSNGALFGQADVRTAALQADVVKVTLSAWDQNSWESVHRPHPNLRFREVLDGFHAFREAFKGEFWVEVFLVAGFNDTEASVRRIADLAAGLKPQRIQLSTATRPPIDKQVVAVDHAVLRQLAGMFMPVADTLGGAAPVSADEVHAVGTSDDDLVSMLERHAAPLEHVAAWLKSPPEQAAARLDKLELAGRIKRLTHDGETYFTGGKS